ncbi:MAG: type IV pilus modification protein PilV [Xanthomonadales bacterium]|nr:type IV pilus modification protein PilV [Xanthomonadales bacterium]
MTRYPFQFQSRRLQGYTLLEVLIALLVFSIGLLGLAAMLVSAVRGNHQAYYRTQAVYTAQTISDGLKTNLAGLNAGGYNTGGFIDSHGAPVCDVCDDAQTADRHLSAWAELASTGLPGGEISVDCDASPVVDPVLLAAFYPGVCTIAVRWSEVGDTGQQTDTSEKTFTWMVQP